MGVSTVTAGMEAAPGFITPSSIFYMLLLPALGLWYIYWKVSRRHMLELAERLPGPKGLPFLGNALEFTGSSHSKYIILPVREVRVKSINCCFRRKKSVSAWAFIFY